MRNAASLPTTLFMASALMAVTLTVIGSDTTSLAQPRSDQRIEILIQNNAFEVKSPAPARPSLPTVLVIRNQDIVKHGFTSPMLMGMLVHGEGEGVATYGKGVEGFYIDPGKTLVIRFTNDRPGKYAFRCDLHPNMKGELYALEVPTA